MSRFYLPAVVLLLLVIEGTLFQMVTPFKHDINVTLVPRFIVVMIVFIGIHFGRYSSIVYGLIFGLVYDIVYTQLIGVYMFGLGFVGYTFAYTYKLVQDSFLLHLLFVTLAVSLFEYYQYGLYRLIGVTDLSAMLFFYERFLPGLVLNIAFAILVYFPIKKLFQYIGKQASLRQR